jgi:hypothetical protein
MPTTAPYQRINIYLDDPALREPIRGAAARRGVTVSAYCLEAIRRRLREEATCRRSSPTLGAWRRRSGWTLCGARSVRSASLFQN